MKANRSQDPYGFTLIELVLFVAILSITASAAYLSVKSAQDSARDNKLTADATHVNEVLQIYLANGGPLPTSYSSSNMVNMLKTRADTNSAVTTMGLTSSYLDPRTVPVDQTDEEAASPQVRAVWTGSGYTVMNGPGPKGIKRFDLDDTLSGTTPGTAARDPGVLNVATNSQWVWDYTDRQPTTVASGTQPATGARGNYSSTNNTSVTQLSAPTVPSATPTLLSFGTSGYPVSIAANASAGSSQLYYAVSTGGSYILYSGTFSVDPNTAITAYNRTINPDLYSDSVVSSGSIGVQKVTLGIGLSMTGSLTYAQAGGAMTSSSATAPNATVTLTNSGSIPSRFISSSKFQTYYGYNTSGLSPATVSFANTFVGPQISLNISNWASGATSLTVRAQLQAVDSTLFNNSPIASGTVAIAKMTLSAPTISPTSGQVSAAVPVSITKSSSDSPVNARVYYTVDGSDPGADSATGEPTSTTATLYSGSFTPTGGSSGAINIQARMYGPSGYGQWFTPSAIAQAVYTIASFPDGALVGSANLNGTFVGSLIYAAPSNGTMNSIQFNSGAQILNGNLYVPGQPTVRLTNGTNWSTSTDSSFSPYIQGYEFDASGNPTVQTTPRVLDETGSITPNNYTITFNKNSILQGKVIRRHTAPAFPTVSAPPAPDSSGSVSLNTHPTSALSSTTYANITNNTSAVGDVSLNAGHYGNLIANNGTSFVLGDPLHPDVTQVYSFQSLTLNSGASLKVVGKVIVTVAGNINLSSSSVMGSSDHSDWLQLQMSSSGAQFNANSGSSVYAELVVPTGSVTFNAGSVFHGSVTALSLTINSQGVVFDQPPVIQN